MLKSYNLEKVRYAVQHSKTLCMTTYKYLTDEREYIDRILDLYLQESGFSYLTNKLAYCIHELAGNAKKANTKRVYFSERGLDINNETEYYIGITNFMEDTIENIRYYLKKQKEYGLYLQFKFQKIENKIRIAIINNVPLNAIEKSRIREKLDLANNFNSIFEAFSIVQDTEEGAGLGIIMMILMLRNLGLGKDVLNIYSDREKTTAFLSLTLAH